MLEKKIFGTNLAIGLLGLVLGIDNLLRWYVDFQDTKSLIIGIICFLSALIWLIITVLPKKTQAKGSNRESY